MKLKTEVMGLLRRLNEKIYVKCTAQGLPQSDDHTDVSFSTSTSMSSSLEFSYVGVSPTKLELCGREWYLMLFLDRVHLIDNHGLI